MSWVSVNDEEKAPFNNKKSNKGVNKTYDPSNQPGKSNRQSEGFRKEQRRGGFHQGGAWEDRQQDEKGKIKHGEMSCIITTSKRDTALETVGPKQQEGMLQLR